MRFTLSIALFLLAVSAWADWRGAFDDAYFAQRAATATGGTITNYTEGGTNWQAHIFTNVGSTNFVVSGGSLDCEVLVVAGGGGGGGNHGGGGGGGGLVYQDGRIVSGSNVVTVGAGGLGNASDSVGTIGSNSVFGGIVAVGGGRGNKYTQRAGNGGSGAGGTANGYINDCVGGTATQGDSGGGTGYGFGGGNGYSYQNYGDDGSEDWLGGGGGGAGEVGVNAIMGAGGNGGSGKSYSISGASAYYPGGGGGGGNYYGTGTNGVGGVGGGGAGSIGSAANGGSGTNGTGGGGGGSRNQTGGVGGSGIVIVRYKK